VRKADNLPPSCAVVTKSGNLNFLEPSVQTCNGTALPFICTILLITYIYSVPPLSFFFVQKSDFLIKSVSCCCYFCILVPLVVTFHFNVHIFGC